MTLGGKIKEIMQARGYTVRGLADKIGISYSYLSDIRNDKQDPSLKTLKRIADALNVDTYVLLKSYRKDKEKKNCLYYTKEEKQLIENYKKLNKSNKNHIKKQISTLLLIEKMKKNNKNNFT